MHTFEETRAGYLAMWTRAKLLDSKRAEALAVARKIGDAMYRPKFQAVEAVTGVPWYVVGCLLYRESDLDLNTYLGNGEQLSHVTHLVPAGRGPFTGPTAFLDGAIDALKHEGMTGISDWSVERILYWCERFNGQGYFGHGNSPYVWAGTDQYNGGLFISDHHYDPNVFDHRLGVAALLKALAEIYPDIAQALTHKETAPMPTPAPAPTPTATPSVPAPHVPMQDPIPQIITLLESAKGWLPMLANFLPPPTGTILKAAIPIVEELLQLVEDAKTKSGVDLFQTIGAHIQAIGQHVQNTAKAAANPPAAAQPAMTPNLRADN